jgi:lysine 6-dehydrogenase
MKSIIVLGAGMVGSAMARDLAPRYKVTVADISKGALEKLHARDNRIHTFVADLREPSTLADIIAPHDLVLSAVPGFMGFVTLQRCLEAGKDVVDISFFPENSLDLDLLAKKLGRTAIVDCGVAPGMDNVVLGYHNQRMKLDRFECLVGGLPKARKWPFAYKAPFSPIDVIEEYIRPARYVENGHVVTRTALSDPELIEFEGVGTLESFNTDGLRSIIHTMPHIPDMKEKTLRYPGHIEYVRVLRETGFFGTEAIDVNGQMVRPMDLTAKLLFQEWKLGETEREFTVMRVTVEGEDGGKRKRIVYDLYDEYDEPSQTSSMARTTGYTACAAVDLVLDGIFDKKGVFPPELVGSDENCFTYFMDYLAARQIYYRKTETLL